MSVIFYFLIYIFLVVLALALVVSINLHGFIKGPFVLFTVSYSYLKKLIKK